MGMGDGGGGGFNRFPSGWSLAAKLCDHCKSAAALLFCRTDSIFLCMDCDTNLYASNRHERVWMCEVCEQAPASITCKADAAALCVTCDRDIHSANPLAFRHDRVPVVPFYYPAESMVKSTTATLLVAADGDAAVSNALDAKLNSPFRLQDPNTTTTGSSWISTNTITKVPSETQDLKSIDFLFLDSDNALDSDYQIPSETRFQPYHHGSGSDSLVPVGTNKSPVLAKFVDHSSDSCSEIDFTKSNLNCYNNNSYTAHSLSHSVSSSSLDVGVVPDGSSSMSEISYTIGSTVSNGGVDGSTNTNNSQTSQLLGMEREARILRYREKRRNRKFEKTIRYASRKAYAETRPRIKGRFAKRTEVDAEVVDQLFTTGAASFIGEATYGVVNSF